MAITITVFIVIIVDQHVYGKMIKVNNNGTLSFLCCRDGMCEYNSLYLALKFTENNIVVNITSQSVLLDTSVQIGSEQKETATGSVRLNNLTITSIKTATVMCNNTGMISCNLCNDVTIIASNHMG